MKHIFASVLIGTLLFSCTNEKKTNMTVTGTIKGLKKGKLYLQKMNDSILINVDSLDLFDDKTFVLKDYVDSPELYYLTFDGNTTDKRILFFGEPTTITIADKLETFGFEPKISGSKNQELLDKFNLVNKRFINERLDLVKAEFDASKENNDTAQQKINEKFQKLEKKRILFATNFALSNAAFEVAPYIGLTELFNANIKLLDTVNKALSTEVKSSKYGKRFSKYVENIKKTEQ